MTVERITPHREFGDFLKASHTAALDGAVDPDAFEDLFASDGGPVEGKRDFEIGDQLFLSLVEKVTLHGQQPYGREVEVEIHDHLKDEAEKLVDKLIADFEQSLPDSVAILPSKETDLNGITYKSRVTIDLTVDVVGDFDWYRVMPVTMEEYIDVDGKPYFTIEHDTDYFGFQHAVERSVVILTSEHTRGFINTVIVCAN